MLANIRNYTFNDFHVSLEFIQGLHALRLFSRLMKNFDKPTEYPKKNVPGLYTVDILKMQDFQSTATMY